MLLRIEPLGFKGLNLEITEVIELGPTYLLETLIEFNQIYMKRFTLQKIGKICKDVPVLN
jgi:hypothetical protein